MSDKEVELLRDKALINIDSLRRFHEIERRFIRKEITFDVAIALIEGRTSENVADIAI